MIKKKIFFPVLALAIIGTSLATTNFVSAQNTTGSNSLVAAIAAKFNLNQSDVQAVFDEEHQKRETEMKQQMEAKLTQAVADGKITEAQKQAILKKFAEMKNNRPNPDEFKNLTQEQRKAKMDEKKKEMETWANQNGIDLQTLQGLIGHAGKRFGPRGRMGPK